MIRAEHHSELRNSAVVAALGPAMFWKLPRGNQLSKVSKVIWDATVQGGRIGLSPDLCKAKWVQPNINYSFKKREQPVYIDSSYLPGVFPWWS